jgi:hypothetical protein
VSDITSRGEVAPEINFKMQPVERDQNMETSATHLQAWADIAVFENFNDSKALETFLRNKAFNVRIHDDKVFRYFLFLCPPRVTYRVQVRRADLKSADHLLETSAPNLLQPALHCPECHSLRAVYPQMTRRFILPTILLHLGIIFRIIHHECYCQHCQHTWNLPGDDAKPIPKPLPQS